MINYFNKLKSYVFCAAILAGSFAFAPAEAVTILDPPELKKGSAQVEEVRRSSSRRHFRRNFNRGYRGGSYYRYSYPRSRYYYGYPYSYGYPSSYYYYNQQPGVYLRFGW